MAGGLIFSRAQAQAMVARQLWFSAWQAYRDSFIDAQGRVIDYSSNYGFTTSEGQSYALFFSLIANDRSIFHRVLSWTNANLAGGRLGETLPAWKWGQRNGSWGVIGRNSASDADSWIAYTLLEAGRLWGDDGLRGLGRRLARRIASDESSEIHGFGRVLVPGAMKFPRNAPVIVNPSYTPLFLAQAVAEDTGDAAWAEIAATQPELVQAVSPRGYAPDWAWLPSAPHSPPRNLPLADSGSYNAIRCYLWAGLTAPDTPGAASLLESLRGMADYLKTSAVPPQTVDTNTGSARDAGPVGFSAALLPYLARMGRSGSLRQQLDRVLADRQPDGIFGQPARYYSENLILFGLGGLTGVIRFSKSGRVIPS